MGRSLRIFSRRRVESPKLEGGRMVPWPGWVLVASMSASATTVVVTELGRPRDTTSSAAPSLLVQTTEVMDLDPLDVSPVADPEPGSRGDLLTADPASDESAEGACSDELEGWPYPRSSDAWKSSHSIGDGSGREVLR